MQPFYHWTSSHYSTREILRHAAAVLRDHTPRVGRVKALAVDVIDSLTWQVMIDVRQIEWRATFDPQAEILYQGPPSFNWRQLNYSSDDESPVGRILGHEEYGDYVKLRVRANAPGYKPTPDDPIVLSQYDFLKVLVDRSEDWLLTESEARAHLTADWKHRGLPQWGPLVLARQGVLTQAREQQEWLVWGPPGTGKTRDAAEHVARHLQEGGRVLMLATANVAVDRFAQTLDDVQTTLGMSLEERGFFRYAANPEVGYRDNARYLHVYEPTLEMQTVSQQVRLLREQLKGMRSELRRLGVNDDLVRLIRERQQELKEAMARYDGMARGLAVSSQAVATTSYRYFAFGPLSQRPDTLVIVDEASMMRMIDVALLFASKITRGQVPQFRFYGDFNQLPPVSDSTYVPPNWGPGVDHWFAQSIFDALGCNDPHVVRILTERGELRSLGLQFRMSNDLAKLISDVFYRGQLAEGANQPRMALREFPDADLIWVDPRQVALPKGFDDEPALHHRSPRWARSAKVAQGLAYKLKWARATTSVMVTTPYRAQKALLEAERKMEDLGATVGTIHALQGQEADVVIIDLVNPNSHFCCYGHSARRLANVALSRARQRVIVVADQRLWENPWYQEFARRATPWVPDLSDVWEPTKKS